MSLLTKRGERAEWAFVSFLTYDRRRRVTMRFRVLRGWAERLFGLLGTHRGDGRAAPVSLVPCDSVHTFGMRYRIDVALVAADGRVLRSLRRVPPGRLVRAVGAEFALERPSESGPWPRVGSLVEMDGPRCVRSRREERDER